MKVSGTLSKKGLHAFDDEPHTHAGIKVPRLWIVVADREKAHIYRKITTGIERIADVKIGHGKSHHEDAGPRGASHHGYDVSSEKNHHNDGAFIQKLSAWLDLASKEKVFDRLVLVASPHTLGDIRTSLSKDIQGRIIGEMDKDLIKTPEKEIEDHLSKIAGF
jgi:protein required for attachment to host cells